MLAEGALAGAAGMGSDTDFTQRQMDRVKLVPPLVQYKATVYVLACASQKDHTNSRSKVLEYFWDPGYYVRAPFSGH